jgi:hypothetical protein
MVTAAAGAAQLGYGQSVTTTGTGTISIRAS